MKGKVFCRGCANLFLLPGQRPMCVATAEFMPGPLREKTDVTGLVSAESRNKRNDCGHRTAVSRNAWEIKRWLMWRVNDGRTTKINQGKLEDYSVSTEAKQLKRIGKREKLREVEDGYTEEVVLFEEPSEDEE